MQLSAEKIKYLRRQNGWSQELLAKVSGLSLRTIQRVESQNNASSETQLALAAVFKVNPEELMMISSQAEANFKRKSFMQSLLALSIGSAAVAMLFILGGNIDNFIDIYSAIFLVLFTYASTALAFGSHGLMVSVKALLYLFANEVTPSPQITFMANIISKQIWFVYGAALVGILIGLVSIFSNISMLSDQASLYAAYAVCFIVLLYAAIVAEVILRPLSIKLSHSK